MGMKKEDRTGKLRYRRPPANSVAVTKWGTRLSAAFKGLCYTYSLVGISRASLHKTARCMIK